LFPIYWKHLAAIDATELIAHRHVWSLLLVLGIIGVNGTWKDLGNALRSRSALQWHAASGILLTVNWLIYIWGVNHGHVIETSLGYFLVPLFMVALGRLVLQERLRRLQWIAIGWAAAGLLLLVWRVGHVPWIALGLAGSWGIYGLLRKKSPLGPVVGLGLETLLLAPLAVAYLVWREWTGIGAFGHVNAVTHGLLLGVGVITAVPLLLFAYGARRIRFATLGLLQYIAPSVQFALGVWVYREGFSPDRAVAFALIWFGLALYTTDNVWTQRQVTAG